MFFYWFFIFIITIYSEINIASKIEYDNNKINHINNKNYGFIYQNRKSYNTQADLEHKCIREVPKIYLEYDSNYTIVSESETRKLYYVNIEVCCYGYKRSKYDWNKCIPICENCEHGICVEPGNCQCFPNYIKNHEDKCVLTCPVYCDNGRCKADGTCKCNSGYQLDETEKFCRPQCNNKNCDPNYYQYCSAPNKCSCMEGFQIARSFCEPICKHNCGINGTCESPNVCRCHSGAKLKNNICQAVCYQSCENGICVSPNRCICFDGFTYDQRTTSCIPEETLLRNIDIEDLD